MTNGSSDLQDSNVPKGSAHNETYQNYSRNLQIGPCNWKILNFFEKSQEDAPKGYKLSILAIIFSITWKMPLFTHLKCHTQNRWIPSNNLNKGKDKENVSEY